MPRGTVRDEPRGHKKKLIAWARWIANAGPGVDGERLWGFEEEGFDDTFSSAYCRDCKAVCPECPQPRLLPAATLAAASFMACRTQFQYAPSGLPTGLRYGDCLPVLRKRAKAWGVPRDREEEMFEGMQVIEQAFVAAMREVAERDRKRD